MMFRLAKVGALSLVTLLTASISHAQTVTYTSFLPGDQYDTIHQGIAIQGPSDPNPIVFGYQFTATVTGALAGVRVPNRYGLGDSVLSVSLLADNNGALGTPMKTWQYGSPSSSFHIDALACNDPSVMLHASSKYWLLMAAPGDGVHFWGKAAQNGFMQSAFSTNGGQSFHYGNTDVFPAYEVSVFPTTEEEVLPTSFSVTMGEESDGALSALFAPDDVWVSLLQRLALLGAEVVVVRPFGSGDRQRNQFAFEGAARRAALPRGSALWNFASCVGLDQGVQRNGEPNRGCFTDGFDQPGSIWQTTAR
ncbi:MAG: hypothetical protein U0S12_05680 [Fimbriimonadales bacterium]